MLNPDQFKQLSLFGEKSPLNRAPDFHEMSPKAFDSHPDVYFHGSSKLNVFPNNSNQIHLGSKGTIENEEEPGRDVRGMIGKKDGSTHFNVFSAHVDPKKMANTPSTPTDYLSSDDSWDTYNKSKGVYYENDQEGGKGNTSLTLPKSSMAKTQADYVRAAQSKGKSIHPETRRAFDRGHLGKGTVPVSDVAHADEYPRYNISEARVKSKSQGFTWSPMINVSGQINDNSLPPKISKKKRVK